MRLFLCAAVAALLMTTTALAADTPRDESTCPAHRAAEAGHSPFEDFHHVMAPAWHVAWPERDYDALLAAGEKFAETFQPIARLEPTFKTKSREAAFLEARKEFGDLVNKYWAACQKGDKDAVYQLMPALHDAFEETASCLLPVHYPHFNGLIITTNVILDSHLPSENMEGIVGSTETLVAKAEMLTEETLPEELLPIKDQVLKDLGAIQATIVELKACCDTKDLKTYRKHLTHLQEQIEVFINDYI